MKTFYAIKVNQPYGDFFQVSLPASLLLDVCFTNEAYENENKILGIQRVESISRVKEISTYIDSDDAAFPNAIILSVNFDQDDHLVDEEYKWIFSPVPDHDNLYELKIPNNKIQVCSVIDGQHRLSGFKYSSKKDMYLACSIYDSLPSSGQATIFSTINFNQRKVDKSLAYQLFGYDLEKKNREDWSPDLLAVYFSRKFNLDENSPFYKKIDYRVSSQSLSEGWSVSSAAFIDGVLSLISKKPKLDRYRINGSSIDKNLNRRQLLNSDDDSPLRQFFISGNDKAIEQVILSYFQKISELFWDDQYVKQTVLVKTIGISALFNILKIKLKEMPKINNDNLNAFLETLSKIEPQEFCKTEKYPASSRGKKAITDFFIENT